MTTLQLRKKGVMTLPVEIHVKYAVGEGDIFTLINLGDGSILLTPRVLQVNRMGDRVAAVLKSGGVTLDDLLVTLAEERERYYAQHYTRK